jgi:hypothetical protein
MTTQTPTNATTGKVEIARAAYDAYVKQPVGHIRVRSGHGLHVGWSTRA